MLRVLICKVVYRFLYGGACSSGSSVMAEERRPTGQNQHMKNKMIIKQFYYHFIFLAGCQSSRGRGGAIHSDDTRLNREEE